MSQSSKPKLAPKPAAQWPSHGEAVPLPVALSLLYGSMGGSLGSDGSDKESGIDSPPPAKRRKSVLTQMEKENRRKIRNRMASQTSRDRKKQHTDDLERRIEVLEEMNKHLMEQNELLRRHSNILEEENTSLADHHPITILPSSKPAVAVTSVGEERASLIECAPGVDEHRYPYNQPPSVTTSVHPPAPPPSQPSSLETSAAVTCEENGVAVGSNKSAALGCVSRQQKPLALPRFLRLSTLTASMKVTLLAKMIMLMTLANSSPSSVVLKPHLVKKRVYRTLRTLISYLRTSSSLRASVQENRLRLLKALMWWEVHDPKWNPLEN